MIFILLIRMSLFVGLYRADAMGEANRKVCRPIQGKLCNQSYTFPDDSVNNIGRDVNTQ